MGAAAARDGGGAATGGRVGGGCAGDDMGLETLSPAATSPRGRARGERRGGGLGVWESWGTDGIRRESQRGSETEEEAFKARPRRKEKKIAVVVVVVLLLLLLKPAPPPATCTRHPKHTLLLSHPILLLFVISLITTHFYILISHRCTVIVYVMDE